MYLITNKTITIVIVWTRRSALSSCCCVVNVISSESRLRVKTSSSSASFNRRASTVKMSPKTFGKGPVTRSMTNSERRVRTSPMSPTRFSRIQEKHKLQNLNKRQAAYIDRVRYLETENSKFTKELRACEETAAREVSSVKLLFESKLVDLRNALDREHGKNSRLELENRQKISDLKELKTRTVHQTVYYNVLFLRLSLSEFNC